MLSNQPVQLLNCSYDCGWLDKDNNPVTDYIDFAKSVLRIPEAHEMIARYTVLDEKAKRLILLISLAAEKYFVFTPLLITNI